MGLRRRGALGWVALAGLIGSGVSAEAQLSLSAAVGLAERSDPRVQMAQADMNRASAALNEAHDVFIPALTAVGGVGKSTGVPLSLPVIFSLSANSLVLNASQRDNVRAARAGLQAAAQTLSDARDAVAEDTVNTYLALDEATRRRDALVQAGGYSRRLARIVRDRVDAGQDAKIELLKAEKTFWQLRSQQLHAEDEVQTLSDHLARLCGLGTLEPMAAHETIPEIAPLLPQDTLTDGDSIFGSGSPEADGVDAKLQSAARPPQEVAGSIPDSPSVRAAFANANAKYYTAAGQRRYFLFPQLAFSANYSRVSTAFTNYALYYPQFNSNNDQLSFNALSVGVQITLPLFDRAQRARAQQAEADAVHARAEAVSARNQYQEGRLKLRHGLAELQAKSEMAQLDQQLAQEQLDAVLVQLQPGAANLQGPALSPKDEQNARLQERERYLDVLAAQLEYNQTSVRLMHQTGVLHTWLRSTMRANGTPLAANAPEANPPKATLPQ